MLDHLVGRCAAGLVERGVQRHDVVGIFAPNVPEYPIAFHGVAQAGATNTTANSLSNAHELAFQLQNARARFLITIPQFLDRALPAAAEAGIEEVFVFGEAEGATPFASLLATDAPVPQPDDRRRERPRRRCRTRAARPACPKGVMLTHRNLVANMTQFADCRDVGPDDRVIGFLPFFHIYGQTVVLNDCLRRGAEIVTMPRFDLQQFLQLIQDHRITIAYVAPPVVVALAKHPLVDKFDLSSLRTIMSGAAPLDSALQTRCADRLGTEVFQGYGLTETSPGHPRVAQRRTLHTGRGRNAPRRAPRHVSWIPRSATTHATAASSGSAGRR